MVKGTVQKVETLQDGSVKLSVYVNKEEIAMAFPLAYQEVFVTLDMPDTAGDKELYLKGIKDAANKMVEMLEKELQQ